MSRTAPNALLSARNTQAPAGETNLQDSSHPWRAHKERVCALQAPPDAFASRAGADPYLDKQTWAREGLPTRRIASLGTID